MSPVAISFYLAIVVAAVLSYLVITRFNRKRKEAAEKPAGCLFAGYIVVVISSLSLLFFPFLIMFLQAVHGYIDFPRYDATVVDVESEWVEHEYSDSEGHRYTEEILMHTAILEFSDNSGEKLLMPNSVRSADKPAIGEIITVSYGDDRLQEFSFRSIAMYIALAFMLFILGFFLTFSYYFGTDRNTDRLKTVGVIFLLYILIPAAMLSMLTVMSQALWLNYQGVKELPIWVVILLSLFCVFLSLAMVGYFRTMLVTAREEK